MMADLTRSRPVFDSYVLPLPRRREGRAAAASFVLHITLALLVLWRGAALFESGGGAGPGPRGGGGGGGRPAVSWFTLPSFSTPETHDVPPAPTVTVPIITAPVTVPVKVEIPRPILATMLPPPPAVSVTGDGTSGVPGQGPGRGGGSGSGTGTGVGVDSGSGSGGGGGYIVPASPKWLVTPPEPPRGERGDRQVQFWLTAQGRVTRIEVTPPIKDPNYRREFMRAMMKFEFNPARRRDGSQVESVAIVVIKS